MGLPQKKAMQVGRVESRFVPYRYLSSSNSQLSTFKKDGRYKRAEINAVPQGESLVCVAEAVVPTACRRPLLQGPLQPGARGTLCA